MPALDTTENVENFRNKKKRKRSLRINVLLELGKHKGKEEEIIVRFETWQSELKLTGNKSEIIMRHLSFVEEEIFF